MTKARNRMTDKLRKACERYGSAMVTSSPTIPVAVQKCNVHNLSPALSSSSSFPEKQMEQKNLDTNEYQSSSNNNNNNDIASDLEVISGSIWIETSNSDPYDFTSSNNTSIFNSTANGDKRHSQQDINFDTSAVASTETIVSNQIVMPDAKELDALTFDLLLQLVDQNTFTNPTRDIFEPRPIE
jgi:hypothetical protein